MRIVALADDLSGANEVAATLIELPQYTLDKNARNEQVASATVYVTSNFGAAIDSEVTVVNTDNRRAVPSAAAQMFREAMDAYPLRRDHAVFLKFDSLLRGHIGVQLEVAAQNSPVVFCSAIPEIGRTIRGGVLHINGFPLHETDLWAAEHGDPAPNITEQLAPVNAYHVNLSTIRGPELGEELSRAAAHGGVIICDAESREDLDRITAAALAQGFVLAGAAGLAGALARQISLANSDSSNTPQPREADVLMVLGTASAVVKDQVQHLEDSGTCVYRLAPAEIDEFRLAHEGTVAVVVDAPVDPRISGEITESLTRLVQRHHGQRHLVLSGGETAQAVLHALKISKLTPLLQAHPGAVLSATQDGRLVATRPGSYGDADSLLRILNTMHFLQDTTRKVPS